MTVSPPLPAASSPGGMCCGVLSLGWVVRAKAEKRGVAAGEPSSEGRPGWTTPPRLSRPCDGGVGGERRCGQGRGPHLNGQARLEQPPQGLQAL